MKFLILLLTTATMLAADLTMNSTNLLDRGIQSALAKFASKNLKANELAATLVLLGPGTNTSTTSYRGDVPIYPASVVKLFYLEAAHRWMEENKIQDTPELRRAMKDMIVESYNEATHYVLDLLTGTTSGPELPPKEMEEWAFKRNAVNRYFVARGFNHINCNQKPWCEGPYGRDRAFVGQTYTNRNMLTTASTARLLTEIAVGQAVSAERSGEMLQLLHRTPFSPATDQDDQSHGFTGSALPAGSKLWSKAGWTSQTRHDAALVELPNNKRVILVVFTENHANEREIIPTVAKQILNELVN